MIVEAFFNVIKPHLETIVFAIQAGIMAIGALIIGVMVFRSGANKVLDMIKGHDDAPPIGYQYEEYDKDGKAHYKTWTRKDQYYYDKARRSDE